MNVEGAKQAKATEINTIRKALIKKEILSTNELNYIITNGDIGNYRLCTY